MIISRGVIPPILVARVRTKMTKSRRRTERANVHQRLKGVFFRCDHLSPQEVRVLNISETGIGIESVFLTPKAKEIKILEGHLFVGQTKTQAILRLVRSDFQTAGFEFVNPSDLLKGAIRLFFEAELAGANLQPVPQSGEEAPVHRYFDSHGNILEFESNDRGKVQNFKMTFLGNHVVWDHQTQELKLVFSDSTEPAGTFLRGQLVQFIRNAEIVAPSYRKQLEAILLGV